jgi:hypothetical protein
MRAWRFFAGPLSNLYIVAHRTSQQHYSHILVLDTPYVTVICGTTVIFFGPLENIFSRVSGALLSPIATSHRVQQRRSTTTSTAWTCRRRCPVCPRRRRKHRRPVCRLNGRRHKGSTSCYSRCERRRNSRKAQRRCSSKATARASPNPSWLTNGNARWPWPSNRS